MEWEKAREKNKPDESSSDGNDPAYSAETQVDHPAYDLETQESDRPGLASTPDQASEEAVPEIKKIKSFESEKPKRSDGRKKVANTTSQTAKAGKDFFIYPDTLVFAKFKEKTLIRYWPAKVLSLAADDISQKWNVEFHLDKYKSCLETCDLIPADSLGK